MRQTYQKRIELSRVFDLVLSLEVAEHLAETSADIFIENLVKHGNTILFSAAIPGQGGLRHLNEQYPSYWLKKFKQHGYEFYDLIRPKVWHQQGIRFWYRQNTFIVANQQSPIAQNHQPTTWVDIVHPELFDREAARASILEEGKAGIKTALASLRKSIATKFGF
ncbi:MAG: hypothetical protein HC912_07540 [Saprospiraceae bacterium]|nr:hypothetical protein [Saprospiraceae bacterium]